MSDTPICDNLLAWLLTGPKRVGPVAMGDVRPSLRRWRQYFRERERDSELLFEKSRNQSANCGLFAGHAVRLGLKLTHKDMLPL
jgi:hypothetical protein